MMIIKSLKAFGLIVDRECDVCNISLTVDVDGQMYEERTALTASWGRGAVLEGKQYHVDLCEECFLVALNALAERKCDLIEGNIE